MKNAYRFRMLGSFFLGMLLMIGVFVPCETKALEKQAFDDALIVQYSFSTPKISQTCIGDIVYDTVNIDDISCSGNPGEPYLPTQGAYILLPYKMQVSDIVVTGGKSSLGEGFMIVPTPQSVPLTVSAPQPVPDECVYSSNEEYPGVLYTKVGVYSFRGYSMLVLMLHPVQYIPASGEILFYSSFELVVKVTSGCNQNMLYRGLPADRRIIQEKVDNPQVMSTYDGDGYPMREQYDLLILTTDALKNGFVPLKNKHDADGVSTVIKTLTDVGGSNPESIREYITDAYLSWGVEYVLLGGDDDVVPAQQLWVSGLDEDTHPYSTYMPSDLYYACLDGPYNFDGDNKWGEPTDGEDGGDVDLVAEVYVGRACVGNTAEVEYFVQKTISYMESTDEYLDVFTFAGEYLGDYGVASWGGNSLDQLINGSSEDGYTTVGIPADNVSVDTLYDRDWPGHDWPKSEIISRINTGVHVINHDGHANYGYDLKMDTDDVDNLMNDKFCFIYSQGCMAGGFDNPEGYDCIAEHFTSKTENGAFAVIMNARYGFFWSFSTDGDSQRFHRQFWDAVFGEGKTSIGEANHDSKEDNLFMISRSCMRWVYYETNLFGDPAVAFRLGFDPQPPPTLLEIENVRGGFGIQAEIANFGEFQVQDISWKIIVTGGIFGRMNETRPGSCTLLNAGEKITISTDWFFGVGPVLIVISADYPGGPHSEVKQNGKQFFIFTKI